MLIMPLGDKADRHVLFHTGRLWCLKFYAIPDKHTNASAPWAVSLSIVNPSPPTWLDSRIVILEPRRKPSALLPAWPLPKDSAIGSLLAESSAGVRRENPPIQFRMQTKTQQLQPPTSAKTKVGRTELAAYFAENAASSRLQYPYGCFFLFIKPAPCSSPFLYSDSVYYSPEGSLQVILEARLDKPSTDQGCVIS